MKSEKGVTLISLGIYIVVILIVLGIVAVITTNFNNTVVKMNRESTSATEVDKFNVYFLQEVKKLGNSVVEITETEAKFATGNKYTFKDGKIYLNDNIVVSNDIESCTFGLEEDNGKTSIIVSIKGRNLEERTVPYVLNTEDNSSYYQDEEVFVYNNT